MRSFVLLVLLPLALALTTSCYDDSVYDMLLEQQKGLTGTNTGSTSGESTASGGESVTGDSSGDSASATGTSSGTDGGSGGGTEGEGEIEPQVILGVSPAVLEVAGPLVFTVEHSAEIERLALFQGESDEPTLEWLAGDEPPPLLVTRKESVDVLSFTVRGYDAEDNPSLSNPAFVHLQLPPPGTVLWEKTFEVGATVGGAPSRAASSRTSRRSSLALIKAPTRELDATHQTGIRSSSLPPPRLRRRRSARSPSITLERSSRSGTRPSAASLARGWPRSIPTPPRSTTSSKERPGRSRRVSPSMPTPRGSTSRAILRTRSSLSRMLASGPSHRMER